MSELKTFIRLSPHTAYHKETLVPYTYNDAQNIKYGWNTHKFVSDDVFDVKVFNNDKKHHPFEEFQMMGGAAFDDKGPIAPHHVMHYRAKDNLEPIFEDEDTRDSLFLACLIPRDHKKTIQVMLKVGKSYTARSIIKYIRCTIETPNFDYELDSFMLIDVLKLHNALRFHALNIGRESKKTNIPEQFYLNELLERVDDTLSYKAPIIFSPMHHEYDKKLINVPRTQKSIPRGQLSSKSFSGWVPNIFGELSAKAVEVPYSITGLQEIHITI